VGSLHAKKNMSAPSLESYKQKRGLPTVKDYQVDKHMFNDVDVALFILVAF